MYSVRAIGESAFVEAGKIGDAGVRVIRTAVVVARIRSCCQNYNRRMDVVKLGIFALSCLACHGVSQLFLQRGIGRFDPR